ncbi:Ger(x)C family spore germination protein [Metabacillus fastidiosus]|uniref:Ger(x)C family spore germination protein n=1 Tax=Metabacillus fastidiosus TaxID=1458 RepID=UPI003D2839F4
MIKKAFISISYCILLSSCIPPETVDEVQIVESMGYDLTEGDKFQTTVAVAIFKPTEGGSEFKSETIDFNGTSRFGSLIDIERSSSKPIARGKMLASLFGEDLAKKGIERVLEKRDPTIGKRMDLCVIEGNVKELLEGDYPLDQTVSRYIKELLNQREKRNLPNTNLHKFMYSYYSKTQDPIMPLLKKHQDKIEVSGLALFNGDKYVDKLYPDKLLIFKMLYENVKMGDYEASLENNQHVVLETIKSKVDYRITNSMTNPVIKIKVQMSAFINETVSSVEYHTKSDIEKLERLLEKDLTEKGQQMIKQFKEQEIDPLGIADRARSQTRGWKSDKWEELYPNAPVQINFTLDIIESGISY